MNHKIKTGFDSTVIFDLNYHAVPIIPVSCYDMNEKGVFMNENKIILMKAADFDAVVATIFKVPIEEY